MAFFSTTLHSFNLCVPMKASYHLSHLQTVTSFPVSPVSCSSLSCINPFLPLSNFSLRSQNTHFKSSTTLLHVPPSCTSSSSSFLVDEELDWESELDAALPDGEGSPWEGAVVYRRDRNATHLEFCTTLERLGLGRYSGEASRSRASTMGIRVTRAVREFADGTPVQVSVDVSRRRKGNLRLDGIVRTVIALPCNRCAEPAAECIFSNFTLLLSEEPIQENNDADHWVIVGKGGFKTFDNHSGEGDREDDAFALDDQLYFPLEDKEIDISKHIRDTIHVEVKVTALCSPSCKGLCLKCGTNLNKSSCSCTHEEGKHYGPLGDLRGAVILNNKQYVGKLWGGKSFKVCFLLFRNCFHR